MIKLKDLITEVKPGDAFPSIGKEIDIVVDKFMGNKWKIVSFNMARKNISGVGTSPAYIFGDKPLKLSSSQKNIMKRILKNPEDIDYIENDSTNIKVKDILRVLK